MAAKAIQIQTRNKKSKRIRAANKFLSNISLDGSISKEKTKRESGKNKTKQPRLDKEEQKILSSQTFLDPSLQQRPKLLTSFSTTNAIEDEENLDPYGSASSSSASNMPGSVERPYNKATSLRDNKPWPKHLTFTSNRKITKYQAQLLGKRIVLCSGHHIPFAIYSTLKYSQEDKAELLDKSAYRLRRVSGENDPDLYGIKGVDIGTESEAVSYGHLLIPANGVLPVGRTIFSARKITPSSSSPTLQESRISFQGPFGSNSNIVACSSSAKVMSPRGDQGDQVIGSDNYDPLLLDDPELRSGRHRKVLRLSSFMVSIIEYVKPSQLKKDLNEQFKEKFPNMEISLSKLRSLKRDFVQLSNECSLDCSTVAYSSVYFEKLVLWGKINKMNRKLVAGSCLLLAAKFNNDLKKDSVKQLIESISDLFHVNTKDLFLFEIQALIALEFNLHLPSSQLLPHMKRLEYGASSFI